MATTRKKRGQSSARRTVGADHRLKVMELRKEGKSFPAIAKQLKLALSTVYEHYRRAMAELRDTCLELAEDVRALEDERLNEAWRGLWPKVKKGSPTAVQAAMRVHTARVRLWGLVKSEIELTGKDGASLVPVIFLPAEDPAPEDSAPQLPDAASSEGE